MVSLNRFKKHKSVFINTDLKSYNTHKILKTRIISQQNKILDLENRIKRLEDLVLNMN
jgi:predicted GIY-YIG superfamily endonuclease